MAHTADDLPPPYTPLGAAQAAFPPTVAHGQPWPAGFGAHAQHTPPAPGPGAPMGYAPPQTTVLGVYVYPHVPAARPPLYAAPPAAVRRASHGRPRTRRRCVMTFVHLANALGGVLLGGIVVLFTLVLGDCQGHGCPIWTRYRRWQQADVLLGSAFVCSGLFSAGVVFSPPGTGRVRALGVLRVLGVLAFWVGAYLAGVAMVERSVVLLALLLPFWAMALPRTEGESRWWMPVVRVVA